MNLQSGKSAGPDGWPIQLIKIWGWINFCPFIHYFNKSFVDGVLPQDWKSAHITPIHKKVPAILFLTINLGLAYFALFSLQHLSPSPPYVSGLWVFQKLIIEVRVSHSFFKQYAQINLPKLCFQKSKQASTRKIL